MKLSCVGSIGLSFIGTLRATHIKHDCKSTRHKGREETEGRIDEVDIRKRTGWRGGEGGGVNDKDRGDRK